MATKAVTTVKVEEMEETGRSLYDIVNNSIVDSTVDPYSKEYSLKCIVDYLSQESEYAQIADVAAAIMKDKVKKQADRLDYISRMSTKDTSDLYVAYPIEYALKLDLFARKLSVHGVLEEEDINWLKENIPTIPRTEYIEDILVNYITILDIHFVGE